MAVLVFQANCCSRGFGLIYKHIATNHSWLLRSKVDSVEQPAVLKQVITDKLIVQIYFFFWLKYADNINVSESIIIRKKMVSQLTVALSHSFVNYSHY